MHQRVTAVLEHLVSTFDKLSDGGRASQVSRILQRISKEALTDMADAPPEVVRYYFRQAAGLMYWAATGEPIPGVEFPEGFNPEFDLFSEAYQEIVSMRPDPEEVDAAQRHAINQ